MTNRRSFLAAGALLGAGRLLDPLLPGWRGVLQDGDSPRTPGADSSAFGARSPFMTTGRHIRGIHLSQTPLEALSGTLTPSDLHYEVHHSGIPAIDPDDFELLLHGMVERPLKFSLRDLMRYPSVTRVHFLECSGNLWTGAPEDATVGQVAGLMSQSEWTGVALSTLFREAGVRPGATWFLAEGADAVRMTRSVPMAKGWQDAMLAYAQNGEALRPAQGYPLRLFLPGWEGNASVKWLRRIEIGDAPFMTRDETSRYTEPMPDGTVRQFTFVINARSVITHPTYPTGLERGWTEIRGLAWTGRGRIVRVDVSTDAGSTWQPAELQTPVLPLAQTRFRLPFRWDGRETVLYARAVDETGYVQPSQADLKRELGGPSGGYHLNPIMGWRLTGDGRVLYLPEPWT